MAVKLGDLLLKEKIITPAQLEEALNTQVIFGGKLGTNLIEMGVSEEAVTAALSRKFGVRGADPGQMMNIPPEVIVAIPAEIATKHRVVPLEARGRRLTLAMSDPTNLQVIDEISFRTGLIIQPAVAADIRLDYALEKYYGASRERRYIHVAKRIDVPREEPAARPAPAPSAKEEVEQEYFELPPEPAAAEEEEPPPAEAPADESEEILELEEAEIEEEELPAEEPIAVVSEKDLAARLVEALDRDDILDAVVGHLSGRFPRCAIFLVRGDMALGWRCARDAEMVAGFDQLQIPLDEPSVLKTVIESRSYYLGPLPRTPFNSMILQDMGGSLPDSALLVPLAMAGRIVGILYVDGKGIDLGEHLFELQKLTAGAAMAFEILVLKNKILAL